MTATDNALARMRSREALAELTNREPVDEADARRIAQAAEYHRSTLDTSTEEPKPYRLQSLAETPHFYDENGDEDAPF